jgi:hypothetical protein
VNGQLVAGSNEEKDAARLGANPQYLTIPP